MKTMTPVGPYFLTEPQFSGGERVIRVLTDFGDLVAEASAHWLTGHCWTVRLLRPMRAEELHEVVGRITQIPLRDAVAGSFMRKPEAPK